MKHFLISPLLFSALAMSCSQLQSDPNGPSALPSPADSSSGNPAKEFVLLPGAADGWRASLLLDNDPDGVWRMEPLQVFPQYATPEVVGLDDQGSCWIMVSYSGKWTPTRLLHDQQWLGAICQADVDADVFGNEIYVGGKKGVLYQVRSYADGGVDARRIAFIPGREIHTLIAGDVDPRNPGAEVLVFTRPGGLYRLTPNQVSNSNPSAVAAGDEWTVTHLTDLGGRIRDARLLSDGRTMVTAARSGEISILRIDRTGLKWSQIYSQDVGFGRLAVASDRLIYSSGDNGRVFRHQQQSDGSWQTTTIYSGPLGPRGLVCGQFDPDANKETVAVFGYSGRVELLTEANGEWTAQTLFTDRARGHWLSVLEIDGRNNTREILLSGYGARMVLLAANPGTGVEEAAVPSTDSDLHAALKP